MISPRFSLLLAGALLAAAGLAGRLHPGFPASVEGQRGFLAALFGVVRQTPSGLGRAVDYRSPEAISVPEVGSTVENLALFDPGGERLGSMSAFEEASRP